MLGTLPGVLLLIGSFLFLRRLLVIKAAQMPAESKKREVGFAVTVFALLLLCALCIVLWLAGLFYLMYVAITCPVLIGVTVIIHRLKSK